MTEAQEAAEGRNGEGTAGAAGCVIYVTPAVLEAGVAYLFASGLVPWNEPRPVALRYVEELLSELSALSDVETDGRKTKFESDA